MVAIIWPQEHGLVLFHLGSVWMEGAKLDMARTRSMLPVGSEVGHLNLGNHDIGRQVTFLMRGYKGPDYKSLSEEAVLHQVGMNPPNSYTQTGLLLFLFGCFSGCGCVERG